MERKQWKERRKNGRKEEREGGKELGRDILSQRYKDQKSSKMVILKSIKVKIQLIGILEVCFYSLKCYGEKKNEATRALDVQVG